mmetsp:Transcript_17206/g.69236  ORF Transcript_17206/g.69236 Transcript_17206/m.69236 type:complete len:651 (+) Transcript_17206:66-2018(+)
MDGDGGSEAGQELRTALVPAAPSETGSAGSDESKRTVDDVARFLSTLEPSLHHVEEPLLEVYEADPKFSSFAKREICDVFGIAAAYFVASVSWVAMKTTDTAFLGHVGTRFLDAAAYADLYTSSTGVFIQGQVLGVFCAHAFGAKNFSLVGTWLKTSYVVLGLVAVPVTLAWGLTGPALKAFGVANDDVRRDAALYAGILATCIPARIGFSQLAQFFTAQRVMRPAAVAAPVALVLNVVLGYVFVFGLPKTSIATKFGGYGFAACPAVTAVVEYVQLGIILIVFCAYLGLHSACRPEVGWFTLSDVTPARLRAYVELYAPAAIAAASDYWRLSTVGVIAATLGKDDLGVFNASYRIMWISLTFAGSLGMAVGTNLGLRLGRGAGREARRGVCVGIVATVLALCILAGVVASIPRQLGAIFTSDADLLRKFEASRYGLAGSVFFMNLAVVLERVPTACGRTRVVLIAGAVSSWAGQVPAVALLVTCWRRSLTAVYYGVVAGYGLLCCILLGVVWRSDFDTLALEAKLRATARPQTDTETTTTASGSTEPPPGVVVVVVPERETSRNVHDHATFKPVGALQRSLTSSSKEAASSPQQDDAEEPQTPGALASLRASVTRGFVRVRGSSTSSSNRRRTPSLRHDEPSSADGDLI